VAGAARLRVVEHTASKLQRRCCRSRFIGEPSAFILANEALHRIMRAFSRSPDHHKASFACPTA
jgi:hypothetical protein